MLMECSFFVSCGSGPAELNEGPGKLLFETREAVMQYMPTLTNWL